jgi:hypothetical protein
MFLDLEGANENARYIGVLGISYLSKPKGDCGLIPATSFTEIVEKSGLG